MSDSDYVSYSTISNNLFLGIIMFSVLGTYFDKTRFYARIITCFLSLVVCASYGVIASIVLSFFGRRSLSQWTTARAFSGLLSPLIGFNFAVENEERLLNRPAVFVSNHQTELDILMLGRMFPKHCSVTSKKALKYYPFLGWFMTLSGTVFIDRANRKNAVATFDSAVNQIRSEAQSVWIFPEGTRSNFTEPDMLPFKKGCFHLAIQAGVDIVPVVVGNYSRIFNWRARRCESGTCKIRVLEPISTKGMTAADVDRLSRDVREDMLRHLKEISGSGHDVQHSKKGEVENGVFQPLSTDDK
ncbi:putative 1-acylglycerol-3-phosphate acyltransferase [Taphrina deformans PYCC 5710]|uniref:1-acyl-sn-glycerol-3-phosphate acyltransferase n=1 Tax=Taphrina deformans (strain PYCC 5710 / ATCC 11124 / CBS 356.35 / IMI 108563 / JCM 9778 / NBRC 8474) TaxID=1097556 RepID=R4X7I7_TAPDE|nr:putative 1-acylglycerol-3-phosphate acyltransferase [Taphrina deformans PYCC 5710]|eukprot:CCG81376.1 putative 1-acylglycerol-3-phosphate acyltransferase [Taphrina deformans PYCC 5710]